MADTKISALPSGAPAQASDEYVIARSGANYKLTGTNLLGLVTGTANTFTADQTFGIANATTLDATNVEVTNLKAKDGTAAATIANSTGVIAVSTKVEYADGTAAAPTVTNTGDTDTGVYFPAANEVAVTTGGTVAAGFNSNGLFFRNRIINGDMRIDQRNAGASVTLSGSANYPVDRFVVFTSSGSSNTGARSTTVPTGFKNSLLVTVGTGAAPVAASYNQIGQIIEGFNVADLGYGAAGALTTTLSFWVRASITGTYCVALANSSAAGTRRSYIAEYSISSANTWEYKTVTIAGDTSGTWTTDNGQGLQVWFDIGSGSNYQSTANAWGNGAFFRTSSQTNLIATNGATFYITGVQLETGSVATPFERRPYGTELQLCQRYYYRLTPGVVSGLLATGYVVTTTFALGQTNFPVPMRVRPTALEQSGTANQYEVAHANTATTCSAVPTYQAATNASIANTFFTVSSGLTVGQGCALRADTTNGATAYLGWSAEL
jgi:hypothetical protein